MADLFDERGVGVRILEQGASESCEAGGGRKCRARWFLQDVALDHGLTTVRWPCRS